jgi:hypothetical protein
MSEKAKLYVRKFSPYTNHNFWVHYIVAEGIVDDEPFHFGDRYALEWPIAPRTFAGARGTLIRDGFITVLEKPAPGRELLCRFEYPEVEVNACIFGAESASVGETPPLIDLIKVSPRARARGANAGKGRKAAKRAIPFPVGQFVITASMHQWLEDNNLTHLNLRLETERFRDHALSVDRKCKDWVAAWRNWMRKAGEFTPAAPTQKIKPLRLGES